RIALLPGRQPGQTGSTARGRGTRPSLPAIARGPQPTFDIPPEHLLPRSRAPNSQHRSPGHPTCLTNRARAAPQPTALPLGWRPKWPTEHHAQGIASTHAFDTQPASTVAAPVVADLTNMASGSAAMTFAGRPTCPSRSAHHPEVE